MNQKLALLRGGFTVSSQNPRQKSRVSRLHRHHQWRRGSCWLRFTERAADESAAPISQHRACQRGSTSKSCRFQKVIWSREQKNSVEIIPTKATENHAYFEVHLQGGTDLHSLGDITNTCFFVGWVLFPWLYWQGWMLCRAQHVFSVCGQEIQEGSGNMEANIGDSSLSSLLVFFFRGLDYYREK